VNLVARESLQKNYNDIQRKIDNLTNVLIQELIDEEEYKQKKLELTNERNALKTNSMTKSKSRTTG
jgi:hypothetical protein